MLGNPDFGQFSATQNPYPKLGTLYAVALWFTAIRTIAQNPDLWEPDASRLFEIRTSLVFGVPLYVFQIIYLSLHKIAIF